ncbi:MAG TPA: hypothetical protein VMW80_07110 [Candidatus Dormibacteraeota bacterium]|nr:hypothetical protein [Candidatus Dormibacteraeota bacterium]
MTCDLRLPQSVFSKLDQSGFVVLLFGGWAEELGGLVPPRHDRGIDLLMPDTDQALLDQFIGAGREITENRSSHKRALEVD